MFEELKDKIILVTGGAGFVGSNLIKKLLEDTAKVICFDDLSTGAEGNIEEFKNNKIDYVFHYSARVGVIRTIERPLEVLEDIEGIKNILKLSSDHGVQKVVFSSSSEVYGEPVEIPEKEDGHLNPKLPYAVVKLVGENYMQSYYQTKGLKTCSLRFFNVYGPKQDSSAYGFV